MKITAITSTLLLATALDTVAAHPQVNGHSHIARHEYYHHARGAASMARRLARRLAPRAVDMGSCETATIEFGFGFDGRTEWSYRPVNRVHFNHGSADLITIVAFICDRVKDSCGAPKATQELCVFAKASVQGKTGQSAVDTFNGAMGGKGAGGDAGGKNATAAASNDAGAGKGKGAVVDKGTGTKAAANNTPPPAAGCSAVPPPPADTSAASADTGAGGNGGKGGNVGKTAQTSVAAPPPAVTDVAGKGGKGTNKGVVDSGKGGKADTTSAAASTKDSKGSNKGVNTSKGGNIGKSTTAAPPPAATTAANGKGGKGTNKGVDTSKGANNAKATTTAAPPASTDAAAGKGGKGGKGGNPLALLESVVQTGSQSNGLDQGAIEKGQSASLTDKTNFINFCSGKTLTNGLQIKTGSCNGIIMGEIPASTKMTSQMIIFPGPGATSKIQANKSFDIKVQVANMAPGSFTNPQATYYAAPQKLNDQGIIIGHTHVTVQALGNTLAPTKPLDATTFAFFKGINNAGDGNGLLSATVPGGLPAGNYRVCTMGSSSNHQPVLMPVAQRGAQDDCQKFTVK